MQLLHSDSSPLVPVVILRLILIGVCTAYAAVLHADPAQTIIKAIVQDGTALPAEASSTELTNLYRGVDFNALWICHDRLSRQATELVEQLRAADTYGLRSMDYGLATIERLAGDPSTFTNIRVTLNRPVPIMILYGTVLATASRGMMFFEDIYGYDRKLERLLGLPAR